MSSVIGIDGGGTNCRAAVADLSGTIRGRGVSGSANIMTDLEGARDHIMEAAGIALQEAGMALESIGSIPAVLGLAGANVGDYAERIRALLPFRETIIESDALISLEGALSDQDGVVAIIGTGSIFAARRAGSVRFIGGWGFMLGDLGSGARIGRDLLQETLLAYDGVHPASPLTQAVLEHFERDPRRVVEYAHTARPGEFGAFAPLVFDYADRGDPVGLSLVEAALQAVEEGLDAIMPSDCDRLCMLGGLGRRYESRLSGRYRTLLREPLGDALQGAVSLAAHRFGAVGSSRHG